MPRNKQSSINEEKNEPSIVGFNGEYAFLHPEFPCQIVIPGVGTFPSAYHLYCSYCFSTSPDERKKFAMMTIEELRGRCKSTEMDLSNDDSLLRLTLANAMDIAMRFKFGDNIVTPERKFPWTDKLLSTDEHRLVHVDEVDTFFGRNASGVGENKLGEILMRIRAFRKPLFTEGIDKKNKKRMKSIFQMDNL